MRGQSPCPNFDPLIREGDKEVNDLVTKIEASPAFTADSLIFVAFDEDDYSSTLGCCDSPPFPNGSPFGGGHTRTIVASGTPGAELTSAIPYNEHSSQRSKAPGGSRCSAKRRTPQTCTPCSISFGKAARAGSSLVCARGHSWPTDGLTRGGGRAKQSPTLMPSLPERLFAGLSRACAIVVACVPLAAASVLLWTAVRHVRSVDVLHGVAGFAATAAFMLLVAATAAVIGGTLGIGCAIAAEELAPAGIRGAIVGALGFLGVLPAVAFGWFAATFIAPLAVHRPLGDATAFGAAVAVLAAMVAPTACWLMTRSLRRVPDETRHAAAAAGASRLQTTAMVIVPALRRRIGAAVLAAFARAIGEATALQILFAALAFYGMSSPGTTASAILSAATSSPSDATAAQLSFAALALFALAAGSSFIVAREYREMQWV